MAFNMKHPGKPQRLTKSRARVHCSSLTMPNAEMESKMEHTHCQHTHIHPHTKHTKIIFIYYLSSYERRMTINDMWTVRDMSPYITFIWSAKMPWSHSNMREIPTPLGARTNIFAFFLLFYFFFFFFLLCFIFFCFVSFFLFFFSSSFYW